MEVWCVPTLGALIESEASDIPIFMEVLLVQLHVEVFILGWGKWLGVASLSLLILDPEIIVLELLHVDQVTKILSGPV